MIYTVLSFDDSHYLNSKCADLLDKYHLRGTFYIDTLRVSPELSEDIKQISEFNEIGSHSITHRDLTKLSKQEKIHECAESKEALERIIGKPVTSFAYPYGRVDAEAIDVVRNFYDNARSTAKGQVTIDRELFRIGVTLVASTTYGYAGYFAALKSLKLQNLLFRPDSIAKERNWVRLASALIDKLNKEVKDGEMRTFHLLLHADHIEARNEWNKLEEVFNMIATLNNSKNLTVTEYATECKSYNEDKIRIKSDL